MYFWGTLLQLLFTVVAVLSVYYLYKVVRVAASGLFEAAFTYHLVFGYRKYADVAPPKRLVIYACPVKLLCEDTVKEIYNFIGGMVDGERASLEDVRLGILKYDTMCLYRDRVTGVLRGTFAFSTSIKEVDGQKCTIFKSGLSFFKKDFTGGPMFYANLFVPSLWYLLRYPGRPTYMIYKVYSYMSYLLAVNNFEEAYPRYDHPVPPEFHRRLMDEFGSAYGELYDPETFVIKQQTHNIKDFVAPISEKELRKPHIAYFAKMNPEWQKGHCLILCTKITWHAVVGLIIKTIWRGMRPTKDRHSSRLDKRCAKAFVNEVDFMKKQNLRKRNGVGTFDELLNSENEQLVRTPKDKVRNYTRTPSLSKGVDRIDEYSEVPLSPL